MNFIGRCHTLPHLIAHDGASHIEKLKAKQEQLFDGDPDLAMLLDNVAAILSEHAAVLADNIADMEDNEEQLGWGQGSKPQSGGG
ncbi:hypothetical protein QWJ46_16590 [Rhizobium sp. CBN3]|uniref:hypothetical protein n=1 Tax=Rhizobium sp. CBN3 TaxID=3058045 RepID=UPI002671B9AA|nr:hypothetical protein [Rhizobium sp. CBN3]MDO3434300.1 hypothetical protein [Rhizobium sp. CBN3]